MSARAVLWHRQGNNAFTMVRPMAKETARKSPLSRAQVALRAGLATLGVLQAAAIGTIYVVDRIRKSRIPGGAQGFPTLAPEDTTVDTSVIRSYTEGRSLYADMLDAIDNAKDHIYFETYVWRADAAGLAFKDALYRAADRGVKVYVIYDGFGNLNQNPRFKIFPKHPNMFVHRLSEVRLGLFTLNIRHTGRTHRKILVVDRDFAFVGGFNIGDDFGSEWRDTHVRIVGPAIDELADGFVSFWNQLRRPKHPLLIRHHVRRWDPPISAAFNLPSRLLFPVRGLYLDALERAVDEVLITTAYFIPDREILSALVGAARRGVKVKILIPEYSNHILADWVARPLFGKLLENGVEIWLYQHAMVHSKTMTVDGIWSTVGTANLDRLSLVGNYEVNLQIHSAAFAERMQRIFANDLTTARRLTLDEWERRPWLTKFTELLLRPYYVVV